MIAESTIRGTAYGEQWNTERAFNKHKLTKLILFQWPGISTRMHGAYPEKRQFVSLRLRQLGLFQSYLGNVHI
eukprot:3390522-Amphidinium_carterae.1